MKRIYAKEDVCMSCRLCMIHCKVEHSRTKDMIKAFRREDPAPQPRIVVEEEGPLSFGLQCRHCDDPVCVYSCITGAMQKNPDGTVLVDEKKCTGCWTCIMVCPYGSISRSAGTKPVAVKCDMCPGLDIPACVAGCPNNALVLQEEVPA